MKKIFVTIILALMLSFCVNVKAETDFQTKHETDLNNKFSLTLRCAEGYIEDDFWGCVESDKLVKCGGVNIPSGVPPLTRIIVLFIKIAAPFVLIVIGMIDIVKAITASDEKKLKEAQMKFVKRLIPAILIFLIVTIVQLLVGIIADSSEDSESLLNCIDCMISDENKCGTD